MFQSVNKDSWVLVFESCKQDVMVHISHLID